MNFHSFSPIEITSGIQLNARNNVQTAKEPCADGAKGLFLHITDNRPDFTSAAEITTSQPSGKTHNGAIRSLSRAFELVASRHSTQRSLLSRSFALHPGIGLPTKPDKTGREKRP